MNNVIEHWRDGEKIGQLEITQIVSQFDGIESVCVVVPLGGITLASFDELHFNIDSLIEALTGRKT